jgi:crossover junction endodeoxyribonuclease RusA
MSDQEHDTYSYIKTNRDYFIDQYPDLADVFKPKTKAQQSFAQPTPPRKSRPKPAPLPLRKPERAGDVIVFVMPLPGRELSPNGRVHWNVKREATKAARNAAAMLVRVVANEEWWGCPVRIDVTLWGGRRMDSDNVWAALKAHRDGVADGLMTTDAQFELGNITQHTGVKSEGRREVEIQITRIGAA